MVTVLQEQNISPLARLFGGLGQGIESSAQEGIDQAMFNRADGDISKLNPRLQNLLIQQQLLKEKLTNRIDPQTRKTNLEKLGLPPEFDDMSKIEQKFIIDELKENKKNELKKQEDFESRQAALDVVSRMRDIRANGNLGLSTSVFSKIDKNVRKDIGEYQQLGKSLISFATNIPIRNRIEFETLAEKLFDPSLTDATAEGLLDAMERIISKSNTEQTKSNIEQTKSNTIQKKQTLQEIFG